MATRKAAAATADPTAELAAEPAPTELRTDPPPDVAEGDPGHPELHNTTSAVLRELRTAVDTLTTDLGQARADLTAAQDQLADAGERLTALESAGGGA